jgi:hypothetical protein
MIPSNHGVVSVLPQSAQYFVVDYLYNMFGPAIENFLVPWGNEIFRVPVSL